MGNIADVSEVLLELGLSDSVTDEERAIANTAIQRAESAVIRHLKYDPVKRSRIEYYPRSDFFQFESQGIWETGEGNAFYRRGVVAGNDELQVQHIPIRSITLLAVDTDGRFGTAPNAFASGTEKTEGEEFWPHYDGADDDAKPICRDGLIRNLGSWPSTAGTVKIEYVGGYSDEELHGQKPLVDASPILDAVVSEAVRKSRKVFLTKKSSAVGFTAGPFTSEKMGDYSYTLDAAASSRLFGSTWTLMPETIQALNDFVHYANMAM